MKKERKKRSIVWKYSTEELQELINISSSLSDLCRRIGINPRNGSIKSLYARFEKEQYDFSKLKENKNEGHRSSISLTDFSINSTRNRHSLIQFIKRNNIIEYKCSDCGIGGEWNNKKLSLQLEHKNGISNDNRLENLCFLCPNCHSQTDTYAGKNRKFNEKHIILKEKVKKVKETLEQKEIRYKKRRKFEISKEELQTLIKQYSFTELGRQFGVSDNAIRKRCRVLGINIDKNLGH